MVKNDSKEVNFNVSTSTYIGFPSKFVKNKVHYLLVININGLLCDAKHVKS